MSTIPWRRVHRGLAQFARTHEIPPGRVGQVVNALQAIVPLCGNVSHSRKAVYRLGCAMLQDSPRVFVSACPPYINDGTRYTYQGLGEGVPLLVTQHVAFLRRIEPHLNGAEITFLLGDHEAYSPMVVRAAGIDQEEFLRRVRCSEKATREYLFPTGWDVVFVTEYIPGFLDDVKRECLAMEGGSVPHTLLDGLNAAKAPVYARIGHPGDGWMRRTIENSAAYVVLARYAAAQGAIVCNHTTPNLLWYARMNVPILHNHLRIYD